MGRLSGEIVSFGDFLVLWLLRRAKRRWRVRSAKWCAQPVISFETGKRGFSRFDPFWTDERIAGDGEHRNRPPWYRPFNALLHLWCPHPEYRREEFHDHPRWSVTICLRGKLIEHTPWESRTLTAGCVVMRSRKAIHSFEIPPGYSGKTWTLFVVGRRNHSQNTYRITPRG